MRHKKIVDDCKKKKKCEVIIYSWCVSVFLLFQRDFYQIHIYDVLMDYDVGSWNFIFIIYFYYTHWLEWRQLYDANCKNIRISFSFAFLFFLLLFFHTIFNWTYIKIWWRMLISIELILNCIIYIVKPSISEKKKYIRYVKLFKNYI